MKLRSSLIISLVLLIGTSACQASSALSQNQSTETPVAFTATPLPTATATITPTITPTATITTTPTPSHLTVQAGPVTAPILLYHHVTDGADYHDSRYNIEPAKFEEQIKWLFDNGYQTITVSELANLIRNGGEVPLKPVVITFDDGNIDNFNNAYPILNNYGFVATFYVVESYVNAQNMINTEQLTELIQNGWEIGSHSRTHAHLADEGADLPNEIRMSKLNLEEKLGVPINSFAYPYGEQNEEVIRLTYSYGYTSAMGLGSSITHGMSTIWYLSRIEIQNDYSMDQFIAFFPNNVPAN